MCGAWHPGVIECVGHVVTLLGHDLAPLQSEVGQEGFDSLVCISKVVFVELHNVLFFDAVDDSLDANGRDCLLEVKLLLELFGCSLEVEEFPSRCLIINVRVDSWGLSDAIGQSNGVPCNEFVVSIVEDEG